MSGLDEQPTRRSRREPTASASTSAYAGRRRVAELWRAAALGFVLVWTVVLVLVVGFWVRVTFAPGPGDELPGSLQILLAPVAVFAVGLSLWTLVCGWRLVRRRASGCDAVVVDGAFAVAVAVFVWAPSRVFDLPTLPRTTVVGLGVLGLASVVTGMLAQRAFERAAVGLEPSDDALFADPEGDGLG